ncbi:restriction endonuclease subunit S [Staphylococcus sp. HMSC078E07]|nr:restriction endonuclease subunit S [Staphylococcus sp. HMSC078E07]
MLTRKMKNSGIKWIGEIPEDWEIRKLKYILKERKEKNNPIVTDNILSLSVERGIFPYAEKTGGGNNSKSDLTAYKVTHPNDIVLNSMNILAGAVGLSRYTGAVSPVYYTLYTTSEEINITYYYYLFRTREFQRSLLGLGNGIMMRESSTGKLNTIRMRIPMDKLAGLFLPLPSRRVQDLIVKSLAKDIKVVNKLINQTKQSIKELKKYKQSLITEVVTKGLDPNAEMKDSGIEWIGKIPKYWQTIKMKYLLSTPLLYGANESGIPYQEDLPRYIRITDILNNNKLTDNNKLSLSLEKAKSFFLKENDILFARSGASVGKTFLISKENVNDTFAGYLIKASFKDNVNAKYIFLFTQSSAFENWKNAITIQSTIQNIGANRYNNLIISLPTYEEQQQIVQYLDKKIFTIDSLIEDKTKVIEELENYKKSLIYEHVTGKKEV